MIKINLKKLLEKAGSEILSIIFYLIIISLFSLYEQRTLRNLWSIGIIMAQPVRITFKK
ncbi:hypothetical protein K0B03_04420 [Patescibacteria group bacterium]|nr:hypothetical protein [Patescibacteria group bacterium]